MQIAEHFDTLQFEETSKGPRLLASQVIDAVGIGYDTPRGQNLVFELPNLVNPLNLRSDHFTYLENGDFRVTSLGGYVISMLTEPDESIRGKPKYTLKNATSRLKYGLTRSYTRAYAEVYKRELRTAYEDRNNQVVVSLFNRSSDELEVIIRSDCQDERVSVGWLVSDGDKATFDYKTKAIKEDVWEIGGELIWHSPMLVDLLRSTLLDFSIVNYYTNETPFDTNFQMLRAFQKEGGAALKKMCQEANIDPLSLGPVSKEEGKIHYPDD